MKSSSFRTLRDNQTSSIQGVGARGSTMAVGGGFKSMMCSTSMIALGAGLGLLSGSTSS